MWLVQGELEQTMAESYTRSANLRALILKPECPEVIQNCAGIFQKLVDPEMRNALLTDVFKLKEDYDDDDTDLMLWNDRTVRSIPKELVQGLSYARLPEQGQFLSHLTINGLRYTVSSKHQGNSCVYFKKVDSEGLVAAQIEFILQIKVSGLVETMIIVRRRLSADGFDDPCLQFPILQAKFYSSELGCLEAINATQITSHYAFIPCFYEGKNLVLTISLSRT
jgi:hypothetical protein